MKASTNDNSLYDFWMHPKNPTAQLKLIAFQECRSSQRSTLEPDPLLGRVWEWTGGAGAGASSQVSLLKQASPQASLPMHVPLDCLRGTAGKRLPMVDLKSTFLQLSEPHCASKCQRKKAMLWLLTLALLSARLVLLAMSRP